MEVQYIRKLRASYMVLTEQKEQKEWERQMIANAPGSNVLFAEHVQENGESYLWYEITGKQALDAWLETEQLGYSFLCGLLLGIYGAVEFLEGILLDAEGILLMPEGIFVDHRTGEAYFCYYPGNGGILSDAFRELLEELLTHLDHEDERAVSLAYGIYEDVSRGGRSLSELKSLLRLPYEKEDTDEQEETDEWEEANGWEGADKRGKADERREADEQGGVSKRRKVIGRDTVNKWENPEHGDNRQPERPQEGDAGRRTFSWMKGRWVRSGDKEKNTAGRRAPKGKKNVLEDIRRFFAEKGIRAGKAKAVPEQEVFFFEPEEEEAPKSAHPTILLAELTRPPEGILRYEGKGPCKDLVIEGDSFVIGSSEECGGYIPGATVSRRHARISRKEGIYFIEDMNSSNGTYVGGELLNYKTKMSLQKNEIVLFADEKFRFI